MEQATDSVLAFMASVGIVSVALMGCLLLILGLGLDKDDK